MVDLAVDPSESADGNSTLLTAALDLLPPARCAQSRRARARHAAERDPRPWPSSAATDSPALRSTTPTPRPKSEFYTDLYWSDARVLG
jgi:hypothetical protein